LKIASGAVSKKTTNDVGAREWQIDDALVRLRIWGSDRFFPLPPPGDDWIIGAASSCAIRLRDSTGRVSRRHARLLCAGTRWSVRDLDSTNGIKLDGARHAEFPLVPGVELGIGGVTLIAESARLIALREFLARLLGWTSERIEHVDLALRAVHMAAARRVALVLCGSDDLVPIANALHRLAIGEDRPFVQCTPLRRRGEPGPRSAEHHELGVPALAAAAGGSLCVWSKRLPRDFAQVTAALRSPAAGVQLIVCANAPGDAGGFLASAPIVIPPLAERQAELGRIIDEYGADAVASLASPGSPGLRGWPGAGRAAAPFTTSDREWVREHSAASLPEIEKGTRRLVALRHGGSIARAAAMLNMSHVALTEWFSRRRGPTPG
jgi:Inner membrane component of T3SS, cytoplasmic domain